MEGYGDWKGNMEGPGEHNHGYFGEVDATGHLRKRSFSQAFVPATQQAQGPPCSHNGSGAGRGLLPTPRWPYTGTGGYGGQERPGNRNEMGRTYTGSMGYSNGQMFHPDPTQNQYISRMLQAPPLRGNGGSKGSQGIHGAVPLVRMPPPAGSSMDYDYTNVPVAVMPPWHKQQEQHQANFRADCDSNAFPLYGHNYNQMSSLDSINNNNEANTAIHIAQEANATMNYANIFAKSSSNVVNHPPSHSVVYPTSQELPPPVIPLEIPPPISGSSSMLPSPSSRPYVGFAMSLPSDKQSLAEEQSSSKRQEAEKPKRVEVKKSTPAASAVLIGKRPGGRHLPTGVIKRPDPVPAVGNGPIDAKNSKDGPGSPKGAWSRYMAEVERYRSQSCSDETPNRPLVK